MRRAARFTFIVPILLLLGVPGVVGAEGSCVADDPRVQDAVAAWEAWVEYQAAVNNVPGLSVGIVHDQDLIAATGFGLANPAKSTSATPDTLYSICSISKLFTSIGVMQLRDKGKLRLDDPVSDHLSWFDIKDEHPGDRPITIRGLLTHSSGLPRESDYPYWSEYIFPTHDEIVARLGEQSTLYPSSRYYQYSNLALTLAGEIVAEVSGREYGDYIRANILDPLGMKDTFTDIPEEHQGGRLALGHSNRNRDGSRNVMPFFQARGIAPAAGFASSVNDLARFASWQFRLLGNGGTEVLEAATLREMQRVQWVDPDWETTRGLGFNVRRSGDRTLASHGGACPGYYTQFLLDPKAKIGAIVLSNAIGTPVGFYAEMAIDLVGPAIAAAQKSPDDSPARDSSLDRYVGIYHLDWGESAVVRWEDSLAIFGLEARDPKKALTKLKKTGDHTFRRVREDDGSLGEEFFFEVNDRGEVTRMKSHSVWSVKVR